MKKTIATLFVASLCLLACTKSELLRPSAIELCVPQTNNPAGKSYNNDSIIAYSCTNKHCGILPLSTRNYWIYEDSVFNNGVFVKVQYDTLKYSVTKRSLSDGLTWWESSVNIGLPNLLYANDSTFFGLTDRLFTPGFKDVKKEFGLFAGDSVKYLTSFNDIAAQGRSLKIGNTLKTENDSFDNCLYFEKNARNYRKDQVFFKEGIGVIKYIREEAPMGQRVIKLQQISTLVAYHIE
ncbi:MAG: hypothetical protein HZB42_07150 [Sphingobacteriales bacterium]|nr:hypothetical protein [Sphingobacteriales bacterium]